VIKDPTWNQNQRILVLRSCVIQAFVASPNYFGQQWGEACLAPATGLPEPAAALGALPSWRHSPVGAKPCFAHGDVNRVLIRAEARSGDVPVAGLIMNQ